MRHEANEVRIISSDGADRLRYTFTQLGVCRSYLQYNIEGMIGRYGVLILPWTLRVS